VEALGRVDVACADKTGTLTEGRLSVGLVADSEQEAILDKLADEGRGRALPAAKLPEYFKGLLAPADNEGRVKVIPWPSWRTHDYSGFLVTFFLAFVAVLAAEWVLRRRWGLV